MTGSLRVQGIDIAEHDLSWRFSRSSGPGGQSVNTSDSRVELSFDLRRLPAHLLARAEARLRGRLVDGVLTIAASEYRSQHRNRQAARTRLVDVLTEALAPPAPARRPTRPSRRAREGRREDKLRRSRTKKLRRRPAD